MEHIKWVHRHAVGVPEGDEKEKRAETLFEGIMAKNFSNLRKMDIQLQEAQFTPTKIHLKRQTQTHHNETIKCSNSL